MKFDRTKFLFILNIVAPAVLLVVPGGLALAPLVPLIVAGISHAEQIPHATGAAKKAAVLALVKDAIAATNVAKPGTVDPLLAVESADHGIDAVLAAIKGIEHAHAALPDGPAIGL
jgi:hypothetical protein